MIFRFPIGSGAEWYSPSTTSSRATLSTTISSQPPSSPIMSANRVQNLAAENFPPTPLVDVVFYLQPSELCRSQYIWQKEFSHRPFKVTQIFLPWEVWEASVAELLLLLQKRKRLLYLLLSPLLRRTVRWKSYISVVLTFCCWNVIVFFSLLILSCRPRRVTGPSAKVFLDGTAQTHAKRERRDAGG